MAHLHFGGRRRTPIVLQTEAAECGLACLAMVASFHGHSTDLPSLRRRFPISLKGATLQQLIQVAREMELSARPLRGDPDDLASLRLPAILHWEFNHFVVLTRLTKQHYVLNDPARGLLRIGQLEFSKGFTGVVLEIAPTNEFVPKPVKPAFRVIDLMRVTHGLGAALGQVLALAVALEVFAIAAPLFQQLVIDHVVVAADRDLLAVLAVGFALLLLMQAAIGAARSWMLLYVSTHLNIQLVRNLLYHLLHLPLDFFERRHVGDIHSRFGSIDAIQRTLTTSFLAAIIDGVMVAATLGLMLVYSPLLTLVAVLAMASYLTFRACVHAPLRMAAEEIVNRGARQLSHLLESVRGIQSIKLFGREAHRQAVYENLAVERTNAEIRTQKLAIGSQCFNAVAFGIENIIVVCLGARLVLDGGFSIGMLFAFLSYKLQFMQRGTSLVDRTMEFRMLGLHAARIADIVLTPREGKRSGLDFRPHAATGVEVRDLTFRYGRFEAPVVENLNFCIEPGEIVAITGASGCGKTTLIKLLLGLLAPERGRILVDGQDIGGLEPSSYRAVFGTVMQDDTLFAGSIMDNIAFFEPSVDVDRVVLAARLAAIHDDIVRMPMQYNSLIGDMGSTLSGGQRQRVILARALYRKPKVLLLDEATSHVDIAQERAINEALAKQALTIVMIAHRPESIRFACRRIHLGGPLDPSIGPAVTAVA